MRLMSTLKTATLIGGVAVTLSLSGCGAFGGQSNGEDASDARTQETQKATAEETETPDASANPETEAPAESGSESEDEWADAAATRSWASDESIKVDKNGNGTIPRAALEADLVDLFANKFDMKVKEASCDKDMEVSEWDGFESCQVVAKDMTYFGTVELVDHKDNMIEYEVMFPGIDKKDLDLEG